MFEYVKYALGFSKKQQVPVPPPPPSPSPPPAPSLPVDFLKSARTGKDSFVLDYRFTHPSESVKRVRFD